MIVADFRITEIPYNPKGLYGIFYALILSMYWLKWQIKKYGFHVLWGNFVYLCRLV